MQQELHQNEQHPASKGTAQRLLTLVKLAKKVAIFKMVTCTVAIVSIATVTGDHAITGRMNMSFHLMGILSGNPSPCHKQ